MDHLAPIVFAMLNTRVGKPKTKVIRVLLDSGSSGTVIHEDLVKHLRVSKSTPTRWSTAAGKLQTDKVVRKLRFILHEFDTKKVIEWSAHVTKVKFNYDLIVGRDLLQELVLVLDFKEEEIQWDGQSIPMKSVDATPNEAFVADEPTDDRIDNEVDRIKHILEAKCEKANIPEII